MSIIRKSQIEMIIRLLADWSPGVRAASPGNEVNPKTKRTQPRDKEVGFKKVQLARQ